MLILTTPYFTPQNTTKPTQDVRLSSGPYWRQLVYPTKTKSYVAALPTNKPAYIYIYIEAPGDAGEPNKRPSRGKSSLGKASECPSVGAMPFYRIFALRRGWLLGVRPNCGYVP